MSRKEPGRVMFEMSYGSTGQSREANVSSTLPPTLKAQEEGAQRMGRDCISGEILSLTGPGHKMLWFGGIHRSVTMFGSSEQN